MDRPALARRLPGPRPALLRALRFGALAAALAAGPTAAQSTVAAGYRAVEILRETGYAFGFGGFAPGPEPGTLFYALEHRLLFRDAQGLVHPVHSFAVGSRVDLLQRPAGTGLLVYADDRSQTLRLRDLAGGTETTRPLPAACFDLCRTAGGAWLAAAHPLWPTPGARPGIWLLDPLGGAAHREIVRLGPGASGPLTIAGPGGDLYCATASATYPAPPGSTRLLRFPAARIAAAIGGGPALTEADAQLVAAGLDGAYDLVGDDRGALLLSDPQSGQVRVVWPDGRIEPRPLFAAPPGASALGLAFADPGPATFDPFQPDSGARLWVATNDWSVRAVVEEVRPARPSAHAPGGPSAGPGPIAIELAGLPAGGPASVLFNILPPLPREIALLEVGGVPVWWGLDLQMPPLSVAAAVDPLGRARVVLPYTGGLDWTLALQGAAIGAGDRGPLLTTTGQLTVTLRR
jgi:hypothetical protein